jgi:Ser-tRNA(Ala) deacylase AlaX
MATKLLYLEDFDVTTCQAQVVETRTLEDGRTVVILDQTCFYPRGGGQDWDTGNINEFKVNEVRLDETGTVLHIGEPAVSWPAGTAVHCQADTERRSINTRLHSAGHLVDMALAEFEPNWVPVRGGHYPDMSFVEYQVGEIELDPNLQDKLQTRLSQLALSNYQNQILFMPPEEMGKYCRHVPANIPKNKPSRIVLYSDDFGIPCGGTHVKNLSQIGQVTITKIKLKKGLAKVTYAVQGIN